MNSPLTHYRERERLTLKAFGKMFGVDKSTVLRWEERGIPIGRVNEIAERTGISRHELRPDIFGEAAA